MVQVPSVLPRIVVLPETERPDGSRLRHVILLEEVIERNMKQLFLNYDIITSHPFRIMRNADFSLDEEGSGGSSGGDRKAVKKRQWGEVIRLEIQEKPDKRLLKVLKRS